MDHCTKKLKLLEYDREPGITEETEKWLANMERYFENKKTSDHGKTCILVYQPIGMATIWWEDIQGTPIGGSSNKHFISFR